MASQTGTLKFRQSDGTYTDLYPKTTIAQVDGLQTQLDSINTSLQNKVDLIKTNQRQVIQSNLVLRASVNKYQGNEVFFEYQDGKQSAVITLSPYDKENFPTFCVKLKGLTGAKSYDIRTFYMRPNGLYYTDFNDAGAMIETNFYTTQKYVDSKINGAITASY